MLTDYIELGGALRHSAQTRTPSTGAGYQRVNAHPVIVQVPDFGDRFSTYQLLDARTNAFAQLGKQYQTKPGFFIPSVGPDWKGQTPDGVNAVIDPRLI